MTKPRFDPDYVLVNKTEAAEILACSLDELDRRRRSDELCPKGFRDWGVFPPITRFRLSEIYAYSEAMMERSKPVSTDLLTTPGHKSQFAN